jgi:hypothetical protein
MDLSVVRNQHPPRAQPPRPPPPSTRPTPKLFDHRAVQNQRQPQRDRPPVICHHCGQPGHIRRNCPVPINEIIEHLEPSQLRELAIYALQNRPATPEEIQEIREEVDDKPEENEESAPFLPEGQVPDSSNQIIDYPTYQDPTESYFY